MTASKHVLLWCDGPGDLDGQGCVEIFDSGEIRVPAARSDAKATGWVYRNGRDLCPKCKG